LLDLDADVEDIDWDQSPAGTDLSVLRFRLRGRPANVAAALHHLESRQVPPRPAWIEVNEARFVRRVDADYSFVFTCGDREFSVEDPMMQLVQRFVDWVKTSDQVGIDREAGLVSQRLQLYQTILAGLRDCP
jgi:hypothetical protein